MLTSFTGRQTELIESAGWEVRNVTKVQFDDGEFIELEKPILALQRGSSVATGDALMEVVLNLEELDDEWDDDDDDDLDLYDDDEGDEDF